MNFDELNFSEKIKKAINEMGFEKITPIQAQAIPLVLEGKDIIGQSQTGTGKTAAFAIPILERIDPDIKKTQAIILCPTRELAVQVSNEFKRIAKYLHNIKILPVYGGEPINRQIVGLKKGVQIIVGTPGRVMDHLRRKTIRFNYLRTVVLDEADEMLNMGFREDIETILNQTENEKQVILFSATMPKSILAITHKYQNNPKLIKVTTNELTTKSVKQRYYEVNESHKLEALCRLIEVYNPKLSLVFCNTKKKVDDVADILQSKGYLCGKIHGDMNQTVRLNVLNKFNRGIINILVATDVAARGLDINEVEAVFNYDVPDNEEYYVHRIGRTGRAGRKGRSFTLVSHGEQRRIKNIMYYIKKEIKKKPIPSIDKVNSSKIDVFLIKLKKIIDNKNLDKYTPIIERLVADGYSSKDIAAALIASNLELKENDNLNFSYEQRHKNMGTKKGMLRFYINAGKNHKVKARDIVGAIAGEANIPGKEIGAIDLFDKYTFVEIPEKYAKKVLKAMDKKIIKGKKIIMEIASGKKRKR